MGATELLTVFSRVPGRWLRCPHCDQRGAEVHADRGRWRWHCRTCHRPREAARRARLQHELTAVIATGHALQARCFRGGDSQDLTHDVDRWIERQEALLRKRLGAAWVRRVRTDVSSRSARYNAGAALDVSIAARTKALERILADRTGETSATLIVP